MKGFTISLIEIFKMGQRTLTCFVRRSILLFYWFGFDQPNKSVDKLYISKAAETKPVKQEVSHTVEYSHHRDAVVKPQLAEQRTRV